LPERAKALNIVSYRLTIHAREYDSMDQSSLSKKLLGINELQHILLSQTGHYMDGEEDKVYPVDVFSKSLIEIADQHGIANALASAIGYVRAKIPGRR
jgi:hypothetical protein